MTGSYLIFVVAGASGIVAISLDYSGDETCSPPPILRDIFPRGIHCGDTEWTEFPFISCECPLCLNSK